jgi:hypothetical protein
MVAWKLAYHKIRQTHSTSESTPPLEGKVSNVFVDFLKVIFPLNISTCEGDRNLQNRQLCSNSERIKDRRAPTIQSNVPNEWIKLGRQRQSCAAIFTYYQFPEQARQILPTVIVHLSSAIPGKSSAKSWVSRGDARAYISVEPISSGRWKSWGGGEERRRRRGRKKCHFGARLERVHKMIIPSAARSLRPKLKRIHRAEQQVSDCWQGCVLQPKWRGCGDSRRRQEGSSRRVLFFKSPQSFASLSSQGVCGVHIQGRTA